MASISTQSQAKENCHQTSAPSIVLYIPVLLCDVTLTQGCSRSNGQARRMREEGDGLGSFICYGKKHYPVFRYGVHVVV